MKDTNIIGAISETEILLWCIKNNISVSIPYGDKERYDQIWDVQGKLIRIQIKTPKPLDEGEVIEFNCYSTSNGKKHTYSKDEIDYFAVYFNEEVYLVPVEECSVSKKLRLKDTYGKSKYASRTNWAKDYLAKEVLKLV